MPKENYTVGWICALRAEYAAARVFLDEEHEKPDDISDGDTNDYTLGKIKDHYVAITCLPNSKCGKSSSASVSTDMLRSFPNIRIGLMVGIAGGAPGKHDIRLGDIVVGTSVYDYTFGKVLQGEEFKATGRVSYPPAILDSVVSGLGAQYDLDGHNLAEAVDAALQRKPNLRTKYKQPEASSDKLFKSEIVHEKSCRETCSHEPSSHLVTRAEREEDGPVIHYGVIASTDQVMRDALTRDRLMREKDVLCFEMEAAGLNHFPCLVIRGICDYSDSHKNKQWQGYAAMVAAAYAKDVLLQIQPRKMAASERLYDLLFGLKDDIRKISQTNRKQENNEILEWLASDDYSLQHSENLRRWEEGTGQWMLDSTNYNTWIESEGETLFCPGIPGAGKTILTSIVIEHLRTHCSGKKVGIAYLYCSFQRQEDQKAEKLFRSLLKQLAAKLQPFSDSVEALLQSLQGKSVLLTSNLIEALQTVAGQYSRVFIIIDALDECQSTDDPVREELLTGIFTLQKTACVNLFVTSRPIPEIVSKFQNCLTSEILASNDDICIYIENYKKNSNSWVQKSLELQKEIKAQISEAVQGMFLLAHIYCESLQGVTCVTEVKKALTKFQRRRHEQSGDEDKLAMLNKAYDDAVSRIDGQRPNHRSLAKRILGWIACARQPLKTAELQHALAVEPGDLALNEDNFRSVDCMVSVCAGLITVDKSFDTVRFIHYTTQEYFQGQLRRLLPNAESCMTRVCITYLLFDEFETGPLENKVAHAERLDRFPLYSYAARFWGFHARATPEHEALVMKLLESGKKLLSCCRINIQNQPLRYGLHRLGITPLHVAAYFGLESGVDKLLCNGHDPNAKDCRGDKPLLYAAGKGYRAIVLLLLAQGATLNTKDPLKWSEPFLHAIINGRYEVMQILLDHAIKSDSTWMVTHDHKLMSLTIEKGPRRVRRPLPYETEAYFSTYHANTPLLDNTRRDRSAITGLLLDRGARCNIWDADIPLLNLAVKAGNQKAVKLLIDKGAHVNARSKKGVAPIFMALSAGNEGITKLLLANGARLDLRNKSGLTPLLYITAAIRSEVPKILTGQTIPDRPPEMAASVDDETHARLVHLLLDHGADVNCEDPDGGTPLWWAIQRKYSGAVTLLKKVSGHARPRTANAENASNTTDTAIDVEDCSWSGDIDYYSDSEPPSPPTYHSDSYMDFM